MQEHRHGRPFGIALDAAGDILVADANAFDFNGAVIRVDPPTGERSTVSAGGTFRNPYGIAVVPETPANSAPTAADDSYTTVQGVPPGRRVTTSSTASAATT